MPSFLCGETCRRCLLSTAPYKECLLIERHPTLARRPTNAYDDNPRQDTQAVRHTARTGSSSLGRPHRTPFGQLPQCLPAS
eukprot:366149-Chlamydomonas_euryale.AAC.3